MIDLSALKSQIGNKKIAIVGLGKSGLPVFEACRAAGIECVLWDDNAEARAQAEKLGATVAPITADNIKDISLVCLSPGVPLTHPKPHAVVALATAAGVEVTGDIELFGRVQQKALTIGITGTNGKSTTTALIGHILKSAGRKAEVGGNIGQAVLTLAPDADIYVLELSSYQLDLCKTFAPNISVFINISADHIDRHGDMAGYVAAKEKIFNKPLHGNSIAVIGVDDEQSGAVYTRQQKKAQRDLHPVSVGQPLSKGVCVNNAGLLCDDTQVVFDLTHCANLQGAHNWQNAALSYAACKAAGLSVAEITAGLESFPGLMHRQSVVASLNGVRYINDSKATNDDAAAVALRTYRDIYWIAGGKSKGSGYAACEKELSRVRHAFLIGAAEEELAQWLTANKKPFTRCGTLDEAVRASHQMAQQEKIKDSVVLLSPACASFDQFKSFEQRGDVFVSAVLSLIPQSGPSPQKGPRR